MYCEHRRIRATFIHGEPLAEARCADCGELAPGVTVFVTETPTARRCAGIVSESHLAVAEGAASVIVAPDFGCVQWEAKP